ncbi:MAG TPA: hypothetical protein VFI68_01890 [Anaerolineales bacterium]|nr:hypothetical protein [Anaerolineales bacterium]
MGTAVAAGVTVAVGSMVVIGAEDAVGLGSVIVGTAGEQAESGNEPTMMAVIS